MKKLPYIAGAVALVLVAALAYVYYFEVRPWIEPPDAPAWAIEERWKQVEALAAVPAECGADPCATDREPLRRFQEARDAIDADRHRLAAALRLGRELRLCGDFVGANMGFVLTQVAIEQAREHDLRADRDFVELRPRADEVLPAVARDAVCLVRLARDADPEQTSGELPPTRDPVGMDRELLFYKQYWADVLLPFAKRPADLEGLAAALELSDEAQLPKSLLLRGAITPLLGTRVRKLAAIIAEYDAFLIDGMVDAGVSGG